MARIVDVILAMDNDDEVARVFAEEVRPEQMARIARRMKFLTHPDRNQNAKAKEAFQRLLSSNWKLKYSKLLKSSSFRDNNTFEQQTGF